MEGSRRNLASLTVRLGSFTRHESYHLKTLQCQVQPPTEEQTRDNAEENSMETTPRVQMCFVLQKATAFCVLWPPAALPRWSLQVLCNASVSHHHHVQLSEPLPITDISCTGECSSEYSSTSWCTLVVVQAVQRNHFSLSHESTNLCSVMSQVYLTGEKEREGSM